MEKGKTPKRHIWILAGVAAFCVAALAFALILSTRNLDNTQEPDSTPTSTPFSPETGTEGMVDRLRASEWVDKYDPEYTLRFDSLPSTATETNKYADVTVVYSISSVDSVLYLVSGTSRYSMWIEDDVLFIDFGGDIGTVEYLPAQSPAS